MSALPTPPPRGPRGWPRRLLMAPIRAYQQGISPYTPPGCLYTPVCSQYGMDAMRRHGALKGLLLTTWRILRCNPLSKGGLDPVPAPGMWRNPRPPTQDERTT